MLNSMLMVDPAMPPSGPKRADAAPKIRDVADDMTAIFGPAQRTDMVALPDRARRDVPRRRRRGWLAALAAGGVATMLAAGVVGGSNVLENPAAVPAKPGRTLASVTPTPRAVAAPEPVRIAAAAMPSDPAASTPAADEPPRAPTPATRPIAPEPVVAAPPRVVASRSEPPRMAPDRDTRFATAATQRADCFDDASCLAPQLQAAERTVAIAYDRATAAQVRAGTLRDYRDEWVRARRVALKRPREALRIYGMIVSDLRLFADDAADGDRMVLR